MKWLHIVAPTAATLAVFVWLACTRDDPWGDDLPTTIQATATVALLAVTASYVVATWRLADETRRANDHVATRDKRTAAQTCYTLLVPARYLVPDGYRGVGELLRARLLDPGEVQTGKQEQVVTRYLDDLEQLHTRVEIELPNLDKNLASEVSAALDRLTVAQSRIGAGQTAARRATPDNKPPGTDRWGDFDVPGNVLRAFALISRAQDREGESWDEWFQEYPSADVDNPVADAAEAVRLYLLST